MTMNIEEWINGLNKISDGGARNVAALPAKNAMGSVAQEMGSVAQDKQIATELSWFAGPEWFAQLALEHVMPLLREVIRDLWVAGYRAKARLHQIDGRLVAQMEVVPPGLPPQAQPPLLRITAAPQPFTINMLNAHRGLLRIEYTGIPGVGTHGGFGAETYCETINLGQLDGKVHEFVMLVTDA